MLAMLNCQLKSPIVGLSYPSHYVDSTIQLVGWKSLGLSVDTLGLALCRNSGLCLDVEILDLACVAAFIGVVL